MDIEIEQASQSDRPNNQPYHAFVDRVHPAGYRSAEIQALRRAIRAKENRLVFGIPGVGMSNLLRFLITRTNWGKRKVTFAYIDCDILDDASDLNAILEEATRQFDDQGIGNKTDTSVSGYERFRRYILSVGGDPLDRLVVVVNKADKLLAQAYTTLSRKLKVLTDLNKRVCYIFSASISMKNKIDSNETIFAGRELYVGPFNKQDIFGAIIEEGIRLEREFNNAEQHQLTYLTGGHPGLLRAISSATVEDNLDLLQSPNTIIPRLLERDDLNARCHQIWQALHKRQQLVLGHLVSHQPDLASIPDVSWLLKFGIINDFPEGPFVFSPVFATFIRAQTDDDASLNQIELVDLHTKIINDRAVVTAGRVFRGEEEIKVTKLELRLIVYLKQQTTNICPKDKIAQYVYCEEQGIVDDSRIEDLVRRVRLKLGTWYIKTHRGKGYEIRG